MDARITKKRLGHMLSYDWIKIIALVVALIVVWSLIFSVASTKITPAQEFTIYNYNGAFSGNKFSSLVQGAKKDEVFSYDILKINASDLTMNSSEMDEVLSARLQVNEGDALFVPNAIGSDEETLYQKPDGESYTPTYLQQFLTKYYYSAAEMGDEETGYLARAESYLAPFFGGDVENGALDEAAVKEVFYDRIKKLNDKRFKSDSEKKKGLEQEKERLEKLRKSYLAFSSYLDEGYIALEEVTYYTSDGMGNIRERTGKYAVNLSPGKENERLADVVYYYKEVIDEEGISHNVRSTQDMCLVFLDVVTKKHEYSIFETLSFACYLVENFIIAA